MTKQNRVDYPQPKSMDEIIEVLLKKRGILDKQDREIFFHPPNPIEITASDIGIDTDSLQSASERIKKAIHNGEEIVVWGDYDVDGICATAILWETLYSLGARVMPYIPHRFTEGYGISTEGIKKIKKQNSNLGLIITVDTGITARESVACAASLGIDVIITDHHQVQGEYPKAYAVIHNPHISGSSVAWFLARELKKVEDDHLGLAALGTVSDVLPLIGVNRAIVIYGLEILRSTDRPGIVALCREARINQGNIDTFHIGFVLGPRLNAMGRIEHAIDSLRLICTRSPQRATQLALRLGEANRIRQDKTLWALTHIEEHFSNVWQRRNPKVLFAYHQEYEEGVVGIVAGRLVEKYYRPALVAHIGKLVKGSARSIAGINIVEMIKKAGDGILKSCGGHPMAAGFSLEERYLKEFETRLSQVFSEIEDEHFIQETRVDCAIDFSQITQRLYEELLKFRPYGFGNPQPTFITSNVFVRDAQLVGSSGNHLKLLLKQGNSWFKGIGFDMGQFYSKLSPDRPISVVYSIENDEWGLPELQLKVRDIQTTRP